MSSSKTMDYEAAMRMAKDGHAVRHSAMSERWTTVWDGREFYDVNPHTGTHLLHRATEFMTSATDWVVVR